MQQEIAPENKKKHLSCSRLLHSGNRNTVCAMGNRGDVAHAEMNTSAGLDATLIRGWGEAEFGAQRLYLGQPEKMRRPRLANFTSWRMAGVSQASANAEVSAPPKCDRYTVRLFFF